MGTSFESYCGVDILFTFIYLDFSGLGCKNWDNLMWL